MRMPVLSSQALEQSHTAAEYLGWVRNVIARVKAEPDGQELIRLRIGLAKELMNEAFPIGLLASTYFDKSEQVSIALKIGNQNFDATVKDNREPSSLVEHIEVTMADDGEDDYSRMCVLNQKGEVSGLGQVTKTGTKKKGKVINVSDDMVSQADVLSSERSRISRAIERKLGKVYPPNTLLLLAFDDTMAFDRTDNIANLDATLSGYLSQLAMFHSVVIVGLRQGLLLCKRTSAKAI